MTKYNLDHFWTWIKERKRLSEGLGFEFYDTQEQFLAALAKKNPSETNIEKVFTWFLNSELSNYHKAYEISEWQQAQSWKRAVDEEDNQIQAWKAVTSKLRLRTWEFWLTLQKKIKMFPKPKLKLMLIKSKLQSWTKLIKYD